MKYTSPDGAGGEVSLFEKRINDHWMLRKRAHPTTHHPVGRGVYFDTHELFNATTGQALQRPAWEWAEVDGGRLIWAADGCLHEGRVNAKGLQSERVLHDFNAMKFEKVVAPY